MRKPGTLFNHALRATVGVRPSIVAGANREMPGNRRRDT